MVWKWSQSEICSVVSDSLWPHGLYSTWNSPGQNTGVGMFPFSRGSSQPRDWTQVSRIAGGFFTSWATREAEEYWSAWPIPSPADLPDPGIEPESPALQVDSLPTELWHLLNIYHVLNSDCKAREEGGSIWAASGGKCRLLVDDQIERCP